MGRRSKKEIDFQDLYLKKIIETFCVNVRKMRISKEANSTRTSGKISSSS